MNVWASLVGSAVVAVAAVVVAVRRPALAAQAATRILNGLVLVWLLACGLGIAVLVQQGGGPGGAEVATSFHTPHRLLSHVVVIFAWWALWSLVPLALVYVDRGGGVWICIFHLFLAGASLTLVLASAFTGALGRPPVSAESYLRFRVLHTALVPVLGTLALVGWRVLAGRYRGPAGADVLSVGGASGGAPSPAP